MTPRSMEMIRRYIIYLEFRIIDRMRKNTFKKKERKKVKRKRERRDFKP